MESVLDKVKEGVRFIADAEIVENQRPELLPYDLAYLGLIGSRRKIAMFHKRLENKGFDPARLARVHAPVGLDIRAETPEEIAVAIVAELIQVRAARRAAAAERG